MAGTAATGRQRVERLEGGDRMQWLADRGPVPQHVGALLLFDRSAPAGCARTVEEVRDAVCERLGAIPALHRRPARTPPGCGGWIWAREQADPREHVLIEQVSAEEDVAGLGSLAASLVTRRLAAHRPPWAAYVLAGVGTGGRTCSDSVPLGLVVVVHHVLADGIAGMALLAHLVDGAQLGGVAMAGQPARPPLPPRRVLMHDAWSRRVAAVRALPGRRRELRAAWAELGRGSLPKAPPTSINRPTGPRREVAVVEVDLTTVRAVAHAHGASVNDALLVCVAATLGRLQAARGEHLDRIVASVPVAARQAASPEAVGNAVGMVPLAVPTCGPLTERLSAVTTSRRARLAEDRPRGASQPLILAAFGLLSALGLVQWYATHQRLVNTFVTTVRGPGDQVSVLGLPVSRLLPFVVNQGNVTVSFSAVTYAGRLCVVVSTDPDAGLGAREVAQTLRAEMGRLSPPAEEGQRPEAQT